MLIARLIEVITDYQNSDSDPLLWKEEKNYVSGIGGKRYKQSYPDFAGFRWLSFSYIWLNLKKVDVLKHFLCWKLSPSNREFKGAMNWFTNFHDPFHPNVKFTCTAQTNDIAIAQSLMILLLLHSRFPWVCAAYTKWCYFEWSFLLGWFRVIPHTLNWVQFILILAGLIVRSRFNNAFKFISRMLERITVRTKHTTDKTH